MTPNGRTWRHRALWYTLCFWAGVIVALVYVGVR